MHWLKVGQEIPVLQSNLTLQIQSPSYSVIPQLFWLVISNIYSFMEIKFSTSKSIEILISMVIDKYIFFNYMIIEFNFNWKMKKLSKLNKKIYVKGKYWNLERHVLFGTLRKLYKKGSKGIITIFINSSIQRNFIRVF